MGVQMGKIKTASDLELMKKYDPELYTEIFQLVQASKKIQMLKEGLLNKKSMNINRVRGGSCD